MNVDWLPNDENAPLPLSSSYRASLRKLCSLLNSGQRLPPELVAKKQVLQKQCRKLEEDDTNIKQGESEGGAGLLNLFGRLPMTLVAAVTLIAIVGGGSDWGRELVDSGRRFYDRHVNKGGGKRLGGGYRRLGEVGEDSDDLASDIVRETLARGGGEAMQAVREARLRALSRQNTAATATDDN